MEIISLDIKSQNQTVAEAIGQFLVEIDVLKKGGFKVLKVIHGYGSHGVGGAIKKEFLKRCEQLKRQQKIYDYVCCDNWTPKSSVRKIAINYCPDLIADSELNHLNSGCSIVIL